MATEPDGMDISVNFPGVILKTLDELPPYVPEAENQQVIIRGGPWLERGCAALIVGTSGIGKSILAMHLLLALASGVKIFGLDCVKPRRVLYIQSEDQDNRVSHDREDCLAEMREMFWEITDEQWAAARKRITTVKMTGYTGKGFLDVVAAILEQAQSAGDPYDVVIINPLYAFIGGNICDSAYVTPFLRGGKIGGRGEDTRGLQYLLEKYNVATIIFHHTPKPPSANELKQWMRSAFPEYQGAGSSDLTNWVRSAMLMMKVEGHPNVVCVTAGKGGARLGWEEIGGARRRYLAWSGKPGVDGYRNAWRELTDEEREQIVTPAKNATERAPKPPQITDVSPYAWRAIRQAREEVLALGEPFGGLTQTNLIKRIQTLVEEDGGKISFHDLLNLVSHKMMGISVKSGLKNSKLYDIEGGGNENK